MEAPTTTFLFDPPLDLQPPISQDSSKMQPMLMGSVSAEREPQPGPASAPELMEDVDRRASRVRAEIVSQALAGALPKAIAAKLREHAAAWEAEARRYDKLGDSWQGPPAVQEALLSRWDLA